MVAPPGIAEIEPITDPRRLAVLLKPPRLAIVRLARGEAVSATEVGRRLAIPRQRANYHVRELARSGFLRRAGRRRRGNMIEQQYAAAAQAWAISPEILGELGADWRRIEDASSPEYLLALASQMQIDLSRLLRSDEGPGATSRALKSQFRFETERQRQRFETALRRSLGDVVGRHTSPNLRPDGGAAAGRPFRMILGLYPYTAETAAKGTS
jgi:hypothetical protein